MDQAVGPPFLEVDVGLSTAGGNWERCPFVVIRRLLQTWDTASGLGGKIMLLQLPSWCYGTV